MARSDRPGWWKERQNASHVPSHIRGNGQHRSDWSRSGNSNVKARLEPTDPAPPVTKIYPIKAIATPNLADRRRTHRTTRIIFQSWIPSIKPKLALGLTVAAFKVICALQGVNLQVRRSAGRISSALHPLSNACGRICNHNAGTGRAPSASLELGWDLVCRLFRAFDHAMTPVSENCCM